jgi:5'-methylthioadenosine phosphorylase
MRFGMPGDTHGANPMKEKIAFAVIGGSGFYSMPGIADIDEIELDTPFGKPSSPVIIGVLEGRKIAFLARHGIGHNIAPSEVNYRANIYALKMVGATRIVSISACGSLREDYAPGHIVIPDQLFDFTHLRTRTFFGNGLVAHIGAAEPFCSQWSSQVHENVQKTGAKVHSGGTLITIEGPRFSTKAESNIFRSWGLSIIGMTASPEAFLAREAEMCYSTMAHVTDYDVWHVSMEPVTVEMVIKTLHQNTNFAQEAIRNLAKNIKGERNCSCQDSLASAVITNPKAVNKETKEKLQLLIGKYMS